MSAISAPEAPAAATMFANFDHVLPTLFDASVDESVRTRSLIAIYNYLKPTAAADSNQPAELTQPQQFVLRQIWAIIFARFTSYDPQNIGVELLQPLQVTSLLADRLLGSADIRYALRHDVGIQAALQQLFLLPPSSSVGIEKHTVHLLRKLFDPIQEGAIAQPAGVRTAWRTFLVINDTLNDREVHLILAALDLLPQLSALPHGWRWILIAKCLQHTTNTAIRLKCLHFIFSLPDCGDLLSHLLSTASRAQQFRSIFLHSLNSTALFAAADSQNVPAGALDVGLLCRFFNATASGAAGSAAWVHLVSTVNWLIVPLYHVSWALSNQLARRENRAHLARHAARCADKSNVIIRQLVLGHLKNEYLRSLSLSAEEFQRYGPGTDVMFGGAAWHDSFASQSQAAQLLLGLAVGGQGQQVAGWLQCNRQLDVWHEDLRRQLEAANWRATPELSRQTLAYAAQLVDGVELVVSGDEGGEDLRWLEAEFLGRSAYYAQRKLLVQAVALDRMRADAEGLLRLGERAPRLTMFAGCLASMRADEETCRRLLDGLWEVVVRDEGTGHSLAVFTELINERYVVPVSWCDRYEDRMLEWLARRPRWLYAVSCYALRSARFMRLLVRGQLEVVVEMLQYGRKMVGDQIAEYNLLEKVYGSAMPKDANETTAIRSNAIRILFNDYTTIYRSHTDSDATANLLPPDQFYADLRQRLVTAVIAIYLESPRHFANSGAHRRIFRLLQGVALCSLDVQCYQPAVTELLLLYNHQPSVLHLLELICGQTCTLQQALDLLARAPTAHARRSAIVVMFHVRQREAAACPARDAICLERLLPLCMGKDYQTRLLAQYVCTLLLPERSDADDAAADASWLQYRSKYESLAAICHASLRSADYHADWQRLAGDYRFHIGAGEALCTQLLVLYDVPRLTHMCSSEWFGMRELPDSSEAYSCARRFPPSQQQPAARAEDQRMRVTAVPLMDVDNVQRKMVPLRQLFPDWEALEMGEEEEEEEAQRQTRKRGQLVVVASLVAKDSNLGGLARTCEIFGAQELVVSGLQVTQTREFQAVSMTAEKWLLVTEVKPFHLAEYLQAQRGKGYAIVGAEQTANGRELGEFRMPEKCVLVLGNEKQGIPVDILSLLDVAVEVPQLGIVRSLNVHVTGALFVWEYAKQHSLRN